MCQWALLYACKKARMFSYQCACPKKVGIQHTLTGHSWIFQKPIRFCILMRIKEVYWRAGISINLYLVAPVTTPYRHLMVRVHVDSMLQNARCFSFSCGCPKRVCWYATLTGHSSDCQFNCAFWCINKGVYRQAGMNTTHHIEWQPAIPTPTNPCLHLIDPADANSTL